MAELSQKQRVLERCRSVFPEWRRLSDDDFECDDPKGFSSFTMGVRSLKDVDPPAVLYRGLELKENAILDFDTERDVFLLLGENGIAAECLYYDETCRIEEFHVGRTLEPADLKDSEVLRGIARELFRFHQLTPNNLPSMNFFELLHEKWGRLGRAVLQDDRHRFPPDEQAMCDQLMEIFSEDTAAKVQRCLPNSPVRFCHNDTYHGNVMMLADTEIKLLDFEFSCLNHPAFDFANLFAETVMEHNQPEPPYFRIADPAFTTRDIATLVYHYLDCGSLDGPARASELVRLVGETEDMIMLSDYMYAMAAIPLAVEPIQKIRFIPYAHARWNRFLDEYNRRFG
ncbi:MAG: phosphotransferase [Acidimicrobiia bacterium]